MQTSVKNISKNCEVDNRDLPETNQRVTTTTTVSAVYIVYID